MIDLVKKLVAMKIIPHQAYVYFNMYILKSIFFGVAIIEINEKQIKELKRINKILIITKLQLSKNFPKILLCARKSFLGLGLISPETVMEISILKVYLGYKRLKRNITRMIQIREEIVKSLSRLNKQWDEINQRF